MNFNNKTDLVNHPEWLHELEMDGSVLGFYTTRGCDADMVLDAYSGFNVCHYTGGDLKKVDSCRNLLSEAFEVPESSIIVPRQTHSAKVLFVDSIPVRTETLEGVDGLVTKLGGIIIGVSTADCVPVVLCDNVNGVYGVAHAGWRGALNGIVVNTVNKMLEVGAGLQYIKATMGPSICVDCFEVGEEVAEKFPESCVVKKSEWLKPHVDLHRFILEQLCGIGISNENIMRFSKDTCTRCHPDKFFSARALGIKSGRVFTFVKTVLSQI